MVCVYDCKHPTWGGAGVCVENNEGKYSGVLIGGEESYCLCEDGFVPRDYFGSASCVSQRIQLTVCLTAAVLFGAKAVFLGWHAARHRKLPLLLRISRRAKIRVKLSLTSSMAAGWFALVCSIGTVRFWTGFLMNTRILSLLGIFSVPVGIFPCMFGMELWVDSLPSQVLAADSPEARFKKLADKYAVFSWAALIGSASMTIAIGTMMIFLDGPTTVNMVGMIAGALSLSTGLGILLLGVRIGRVINRAEAKARQESKAYYRKAKKKLWVQVLALFIASTSFAAVSALGVLLLRARWTPLIHSMMQMAIASSAYVMAVHFSRPNLSSVMGLPSSSAAAYVDSRPGSGQK